MGLRNRAPISTSASQTTPARGYSKSNQKLTAPKKRNIQKVALRCIFVLIFLYTFPLILVWCSAWLRDEIVFVHHLRRPFFANISDPHSFGLQAVRQFELFHENGCGIETWQMLSNHYHTEEHNEKPFSDADFNHALSDGSAIVLYLHGNTGTRALSHRVNLYKYLSGTLGHHVITFDYRGFGNSQCYPSELGMMEDSLLIWTWLREKAPKAKIYIWGHSLGSAAATYLAQNLCQIQDQPSGLILDAPFTNIMEAGENHPITFIYRPIMPLISYFILENLEQKFASVERMDHITCPILIVHGGKDGVVPLHLGMKLYQKTMEGRRAKSITGGSVEFLKCEETSHKNNWESSKMTETLQQFIKP